MSSVIIGDRHLKTVQVHAIMQVSAILRLGLIDKIIFADSRETLVTATRALDRVLLHNNFVILSFIITDRIVYWDRFGHPDLPKYVLGSQRFGGLTKKAARIKK